jgi:phosphoribosylformimino-5-aminoimidazole carboxamide ribotide isomerase
MRIIPVMDLRHGLVVRGVEGRRSEYRPIQSQIAADSRPASIATAFSQKFGFRTAYVADLDAIMDGRPSVDSWREIAGAGLELWLDGGFANRDSVRRSLENAGVHGICPTIVIGLESLETQEELTAITRACEIPPIFSLDLQGGRPLGRCDEWKDCSPREIAAQVVDRGITRLIVLDLADVGVAAGTRTMQLCQQIRRDHSAVELIAGGGVRGRSDLEELAQAGCDAALVASALHDGRLSSDDVQTSARMER